jgi:outer membrane lipoprotein-sorting protein
MSAQRRRRAILLALALLAIPTRPEPLVARTTVPDLFDEIYERGKGIDASLKTLTARFVETSSSSLLERPLVAKGTVAVERPDRVVLHYSEPDRHTILIDRGTLTTSWPGRGLRTSSDISASQHRVQKYFVDKSPQELRRHFTISAQIAPDRPGTWHVMMVPTRKQLREGVVKIELWIDRQRLLLSALSLTFADGDTKLLEFSEIVMNPTLTAQTFSAP